MIGRRVSFIKEIMRQSGGVEPLPTFSSCNSSKTFFTNYFRLYFMKKSTIKLASPISWSFLSQEAVTNSKHFELHNWTTLLIVLVRTKYSSLSNNRTVSNKSIQGHYFGLLLHRYARFLPFLTHSCHEINNRTCTIIREARVNKKETGIRQIFT